MGSDFFQFKQFVIEQKNSAMRVGTDGILMGAWAEINNQERSILDIGCGTGLIAMMLAQRNQTAAVDAVEIEPLAAAEAALNASRSPWADRIIVHEISLQEYTLVAKRKYDLIVSNPPYFINSSHNEKLARAAARHASLLPYSDLIFGVTKLLDEDGRFCAIFPYSEAGVFIAKASLAGLYCNRKLNIYSKHDGLVKRIAAVFSFRETEIVEENLIINKGNGEYTEEYKRLTCPFYLRF